MRGVPHLHVVICCHPELPFNAVDNCVSAEMPRSGPNLEARRRLVREKMTHRHSERCGRQAGVECSYGFPKPIHPETTITADGKVTYRRREEEDRWIVAHHSALLEGFQCHINVEVCWGPETFGYLFKYFWKRTCTWNTICSNTDDAIENLTARLRLDQNEEAFNEEENYILHQVYGFNRCGEPDFSISYVINVTCGNHIARTPKGTECCGIQRQRIQRITSHPLADYETAGTRECEL